MRAGLAWFFARRDDPPTVGNIVAWWEARRIPFNVIVGSYGVVCLIIFFVAIGASDRLAPGDDAVEPIALLAAPFGINILYTLGWLVEIPGTRLAPGVDLGPTLLKLGLSLGLFLITLPAAFWSGVVVLQLLGLAK